MTGENISLAKLFSPGDDWHVGSTTHRRQISMRISSAFRAYEPKEILNNGHSHSNSRFYRGDFGWNPGLDYRAHLGNHGQTTSGKFLARSVKIIDTGIGKVPSWSESQ